MSQKILCFAGRSESGKSTIANWLSGLFLQELGMIDHHSVNEKGQLVIPVIIEDKVVDKVINFNRETLWLKEKVYPHIKQYAFADKLKEYCQDMFGFTWDNLNGTGDQKNSPSHLKWGQVPDKFRKQYQKTKTDIMSFRDVLVVFGTICRDIDPDCLVRACTKKIDNEGSKFCIITDGRYPNEIEPVQKRGGLVIYLTRNPKNFDHNSETALDKENFDHSKFDLVLDNSNMTIGEQNKAIFEYLQNIGWIDFEIGELSETTTKN